MCSYLDQLVRDQGLATERTMAIGSALDAAEALQGKARRDALNALNKTVERDVAGAKDAAKVKTMAEAIKALAKATNQAWCNALAGLTAPPGAAYTPSFGAVPPGTTQHDARLDSGVLPLLQHKRAVHQHMADAL